MSEEGGCIYSQDYQPVAELKPWQASTEDDSYVNKDRAQGKEVTTEAEIQLRNKATGSDYIKQVIIMSSIKNFKKHKTISS